ncbi:MAG: BPSS1187 family protein [Phycisphaerales bacterium]
MIRCHLAAAAVVCTAPSLAGAQPTLRFIDPLDTDPGIVAVEVSDSFENQPQRHAVAPSSSAAPQGRLLVWMPGSGALPNQYLIFTRTAASLGFDVVGLVYPSLPAVNDLTTQSTDPELPEAIRRERLFGEDSTDIIDVDRANSIENRLVRLLEHQAAAFPGERWADYLDGAGGVRWDRVVAAGHSQGAGHAVFLGKLEPLAGALIFGGPGDFVQGFGTAPWVITPGVTTATHTLAFTHTEDATAAAFFTNQLVLGLDAFGPLENADGKTPAELASHMLTSTYPVPPGSNGHGAVIADARMPFDANGDPVYAPVWAFMLSRVTPRCTPDTNGNGTLDPGDFTAWLAAYNATQPRADQNGDGIISPADFTAWTANFAAGC